MGGFKLGKMTLSGLFKQPETIQYPVQKKEPPAGLKGHVTNDTGACILCGICQKRCPTAPSWWTSRRAPGRSTASAACSAAAACANAPSSAWPWSPPTRRPPPRSTSTPSRCPRGRRRRSLHATGRRAPRAQACSKRIPRSFSLPSATDMSGGQFFAAGPGGGAVSMSVILSYVNVDLLACRRARGHQGAPCP